MGTDKTEGIAATPQAEQHAAEQGLDLTQVKGTGAGGKVTKADVEAFLAQQSSTSQDPVAPAEPIAETQGSVVDQPEDPEVTEEDVVDTSAETAAAKAEQIAIMLQGRGYVRTGDNEYTSSTWGIVARIELNDDGTVDVSTMRDNEEYKPRFHNVTVEYLAGQIP